MARKRTLSNKNTKPADMGSVRGMSEEQLERLRQRRAGKANSTDMARRAIRQSY